MHRSRLVLSLALAAAVAEPASAIEILVYNSADSVDVDPGDGLCDADSSPGGITCTLRAAIMEANALPGHDTIRLNPGTYALSIAPSSVNLDSSGDLNITDDLTLEGGVGRIVDGADVDSVFSIGFSSVTIRDLEVRNGRGGNVGCILVGGFGELLLERSQVLDCEGGTGGGVRIIANGRATLRDVWISGNSSTFVGGGVLSAGGEVLIERSTISGNAATVSGGGLSVTAAGTGGPTVLVNSTVRSNFAGDHGGGLHVTDSAHLYNSAVISNSCSTDLDGAGEGGGVYSAGAGSSVVLANSVVALNECGPFVLSQIASDCVGSLQLAGYNFVGLTDGCTISGSGAGDILGSGTALDPGLGPFAFNGGFTPTHHPTAGSPLPDAGDPAGCQADRDGAGPGVASTLMEDQRGEPRPALARCDIGPVEGQWIFADGFESGDTSAWSL